MDQLSDWTVLNDRSKPRGGLVFALQPTGRSDNMENVKRGIKKGIVTEEVLRLLLVDDHAVVRKGLGLLLGMDERFQVVAEVERGDEAKAAYTQFLPDVVLMDVRMPGKDGVEALAEIRSDYPDAKVLILTSYDLDEDVFRALDAGAAGYVLKTVGHEELFEAIHCVHGGGRYLPGDIAGRMEGRNPKAQLSPRELETLDLLAKGYTNREIGLALGISERTGKAHVEAILSKLEVADRAEAVDEAYKRGLLKV